MKAINYIVKLAPDSFDPNNPGLSNFEAYEMMLEFMFSMAGDTQFENRVISAYETLSEKYGEFSVNDIGKAMADQEFLESQLTSAEKEKFLEMKKSKSVYEKEQANLK